jgi:hypothetical protein
MSAPKDVSYAAPAPMDLRYPKSCGHSRRLLRSAGAAMRGFFLPARMSAMKRSVSSK